MPNVSTKRTKRKMADSEPPSKSSKVTFLSPSLILLEIPADTNTSLPVWDAMRSQQVDIAWNVSPYSVSVQLTPATSKQGQSTPSSHSESTSIVAAQTLVPSAGILQPQMVVQSISQQHGASQNSCIMLTLSQNTTQLLPSLLQNVPPNPTPATSLLVSLPLIITQPQPAADQPGTPAKQQILTPTATPTKLQAPSKVPAPSSFYTKISSDVQVCDNFLLGLCHTMKKCKMHHTPYPFHWQLWNLTTHQWIDIPSRSQVLLEKIYCNVGYEGIRIKDGPAYYTLDFESMELDDSSKYDGVRRLTNSDSALKNPYFPSKLKIYWWNNRDWEEYNKDLSVLLLKKMSVKEPECSFHIGSQEYKLDFTTMTQTNVTTGFQREVRCRPAYRSPDSMQPYLQTGIHTEPTEPVSDPPGANFSVDPLEEFSSWYPPVWCLVSEEDYNLVDLPAGSQAYRSVLNLFYESLPETKVDIVSIQQVQNLLHWDKYQRHKAYMQKQGHTKSQEPLERHLFHGTNKNASEDICHNNFDPRMAGLHGTSQGFGSYFATTAAHSHTYSVKEGPDEVRHMFLAKVLVGRVSPGRNSYHRPPPLNKAKKFCLYDTCVDDMNKPTMFVVFDSCQCYPYYLIKYKDLSIEIDIS